MKEIPLTQGQVALVDDEDFEELNKFKWRAAYSANSNIFYAIRDFQECDKRTFILMHRQIMGVSDVSLDVDHRDHNGLNNQRYNLRACTSIQNQHNSRKLSNGTSRYKGVSWDKRRSHWRAQIKLESCGRIWLGYFNDEEQAARAYDTAAMKYFGEYAYLNFPEG